MMSHHTLIYVSAALRRTITTTDSAFVFFYYCDYVPYVSHPTLLYTIHDIAFARHLFAIVVLVLSPCISLRAAVIWHPSSPDDQLSRFQASSYAQETNKRRLSYLSSWRDMFLIASIPRWDKPYLRHGSPLAPRSFHDALIVQAEPHHPVLGRMASLGSFDSFQCCAHSGIDHFLPMTARLASFQNSCVLFSCMSTNHPAPVAPLAALDPSVVTQMSSGMDISRWRSCSVTCIDRHSRLGWDWDWAWI